MSHIQRTTPWVVTLTVLTTPFTRTAGDENGAWTSSEIRFVADGGIELGGTLFVPSGVTSRAYPGVLLLPGSGPTDRDGNQPPLLRTNLLRQIAEHLAANGFASFRFDKRAVHANVKTWPNGMERQNEFFALERFVGDASAALRLLGNDHRVDARRLAILGHSEGGLIALNLVKELGDRAPRALILAATAATDFRELIPYQIEGAMTRQGADEASKAKYLAALQDAIQLVLEGKPVPNNLPVGLRMLFPANAMKLLHSYFTIDPAELARAYPWHALAVHGEEDVQIPVDHSTEIFRAAFGRRTSGSYEAITLPNASHNLKEVNGPGDPGFTGPVVPQAVDGLIDWLERVGLPDPG